MEPLKYYERGALIWKLEDVSSTEKFVLLALNQYADSSGGSCFPSAKKIAKDTCLARPTVSKTLKKLAERGLITISPRYTNGLQTSNDYRVEYLNIASFIRAADGVTEDYNAVTEDYTRCNAGLQQVLPTITAGVTEDYTDQIQITNQITDHLPEEPAKKVDPFLTRKTETPQAIVARLISDRCDYKAFIAKSMADMEQWWKSGKVTERTVLQFYAKDLKIYPMDSEETKAEKIAVIAERIETRIDELELNSKSAQNQSQEDGSNAFYEGLLILYKKNPAEARISAGRKWNKFYDWMVKKQDGKRTA
jgi:hypothetical protein